MKLSDDQLGVVQALKGSRSVAVFGPAGTGKSFLRSYIAELVPTVLLGPTGTSVETVKHGMTISRFLEAKPHTSNDAGALASRMRCPENISAKTLLIDEIAMVGTFASINK